jgi:hypothetical protein
MQYHCSRLQRQNVHQDSGAKAPVSAVFGLTTSTEARFGAAIRSSTATIAAPSLSRTVPTYGTLLEACGDGEPKQQSRMDKPQCCVLAVNVCLVDPWAGDLVRIQPAALDIRRWPSCLFSIRQVHQVRHHPYLEALHFQLDLTADYGVLGHQITSISWCSPINRTFISDIRNLAWCRPTRIRRPRTHSTGGCGVTQLSIRQQ